eukprot:TRINITY_DN32883_c0_g1_i1.p1 TRINITY_DN32883_c0_g1~~TRINITY_DN32883_c0_g1_i1.p1  ORF type:complete len:540 (-),score=103.10 TRINITY_DN32883_c0_g1_i1:172-1791(-)
MKGLSLYPLLSLACLSSVLASTCLNGACYPGNEFCGQPFTNAPMYHLMDQHGCGENDPNGPVFDPVHGVVHHFYQIHLAAGAGHGPDYGHFVSKDFIHWAAMPVAIWNGLDTSVWPPTKTPYDNEAIFTGSAVIVDGAGPDGKGPGVVNLYPGLCNKNDWPACGTGTLLAQAVPANYGADPLLTNWSKPSYNPIMQNTERDPSTPWKTPSGEWRFRTYNSKVYGSASDADMLAGKWYEIGVSPDLRTCECPSLYPLPAASLGFEYDKDETLPTHVHKTSCSGDWWQIGTYEAGAPKTLGGFAATPGWEELFEQRKIDQGNFYASKDNIYPTVTNDTRRINWGWAQVPPQSTQTLPREVTFNPVARCLQQLPIDEIKALRGPAAFSKTAIPVPANSQVVLQVAAGVAKQSEVVVTFDLPAVASTFGVSVDGTACTVQFSPNTNSSAKVYEVPVTCGKFQDSLRLITGEKTVEIRLFADATFLEVFFQQGRVAMTVSEALSDQTKLSLNSTVDMSASAEVFPMSSIWVSPDDVLNAPRVYN